MDYFCNTCKIWIVNSPSNISHHKASWAHFKNEQIVNEKGTETGKILQNNNENNVPEDCGGLEGDAPMEKGEESFTEWKTNFFKVGGLKCWKAAF